LAGRRRRHVVADDLHHLLPLRQLPERERRLPLWPDDLAVRDGQFVARHASLLRRQVEQQLAHAGGDAAQLGRHVGRRPAAGDAEKLAAVDLQFAQLVALGLAQEVVERLSVHLSPPFIALAAIWIAVMMRAYAPQRQMWPDRARAMSSRLGSGSRLSSAAAV